MNNVQRKIVVVGVILALAMLLFPPWAFQAGNGRVIAKGYAFIGAPPDRMVSVHISLLLVQWVAVIGVGGVLFWLSKDKEQ